MNDLADKCLPGGVKIGDKATNAANNGGAKKLRLLWVGVTAERLQRCIQETTTILTTMSKTAAIHRINITRDEDTYVTNAKQSNAIGPGIQPNCDMLHARESTPDPITAVMV
ncbi:hypothetical protein L1887_07731 [Cichorium endivia]|nr:hypothetical protein L1887_07731 [Cichorium endivia]